MVARFRDLTYTYPGGAHPALRSVRADLSTGLTLVAGSSGGGKSTLLRTLNGLVPHFHGGTISGDVEVLGVASASASTRELATSVGFVFQDPERQLVATTVDREVAFGPRNLGLAASEVGRRVSAALEATGVAHLRRRQVRALSGGEKQRVALAGVLAMQPRLLVLDEATSQLDAAGAEAIMDILASLRDLGAAVVVAEHRLERLLPACDSMLVVEDGSVTGPSGARSLAAKLPSPPQVVELGVRLGWTDIPLSLTELGPRAPRTLLSRAPAAPGGRTAWATTELTCGAAGTTVLDGVTLVGRAGEVIALMGRNGGGKTTLLRAIAGLLPPLAGSVERAPGQVAYLPQDPAAILHRASIRAEVQLTLRWAGVDDDPDAVLARCGCTGLGDRDPRDLSGGQRQRAAIAVVLAGAPSLALLDEPTRGMDGSARAVLVRVITGLREAGGSVVIATHDSVLAALVADRVLLVEGGTVRDLGHPTVALSGNTPHATQLGRLYPGGPVTVDGLIAAMAG